MRALCWKMSAAMGLSLAACEGEPAPQPKPYEVQFVARDSSGDPVPAVEIRDEASDAVITSTDEKGHARFGATGLPGSRLVFRVRPPADFKLVDQGERREVLLRPNPAQQPVVLHEIGLRPLKLGYVLLIDSEVPFSDILVNGASIGHLNSQGSGAFLYPGVPETTVTTKLVPPEQYWISVAKGARCPGAKQESPPVQDDARAVLSTKLSERMEERILHVRITLPAAPSCTPPPPKEYRPKSPHIPRDVSPDR